MACSYSAHVVEVQLIFHLQFLRTKLVQVHTAVTHVESPRRQRSIARLLTQQQSNGCILLLTAVSSCNLLLWLKLISLSQLVFFLTLWFSFSINYTVPFFPPTTSFLVCMVCLTFSEIRIVHWPGTDSFTKIQKGSLWLVGSGVCAFIFFFDDFPLFQI